MDLILENLDFDYLLMTEKINNIYSGEFYLQGVLFCPVDRFEDSFMDVLGERKSLDFMATGSKENFKDYDSFKAYLMSLIETIRTPSNPSVSVPSSGRTSGTGSLSLT